MTKLSKTQQELLDAMKGGVKVVYMHAIGSWNPQAYYFRDDNYKPCTAAAKALLEKGFAEKCNQQHNGGHNLCAKEQP